MDTDAPHDITETRIRNEEIRMLYSAIPFSAFATVVVSLIYLVILFEHAQSRQNLLTWFALMLLITAARGWDTWRYQRAAPALKQRTGLWEKRFLLGTTLAGTGWGMLAWMGYSTVNEYQALIVVGLIGVCGGAMSTLSYKKQALAFFLIPALGLLELFLITETTEFSGVTAYLVAFYMVFTLFTSKRIYQNTHANVRLRMEADVREKTLLKTKEDAERANQAKSEFLSHMSHELRTPLNAIIGFTQLLEYDNQLNERQRQQIQEIAQAGSHLLSLVNRILDLSRIEEGSLQLSIRPVSVNALLNECLSLTRSLAEKHLVTLSSALDRQYTVQADYTALKQVLLNLLSNAIKYNKAGGSVFIHCSMSADDSVRIHVRDTGIGLSLEQIEYIFEPFNRLDSASRKIEGTGIGLTITRDLVKHMHGKLGAEGKISRGSLFWVELPGSSTALPEQPATPFAPPASQPEPAQQPMAENRLRILIAEDNPANQLLLANQIKLFGHDCDQANNGEQALELFKRHAYDLVLTDCNMPIMDGYQLSHAIRAINPGIPIIAITADAFPASEDRCASAGMNDRLVKPVQLYALKDIIAKWTGRQL